MNESKENVSFFSEICINQCRGRCCDPWWGIIEFTIVKKDGFSRLNSFKNDVIREIGARAERIIEKYATNENPPRRLFKEPERYNIKVEDIKFKGQSVMINIRAMFAFRCLFLSKEKACAIHPAVLRGDDIRPQHCGFMGSPDARPGGKGYCRIIHAAGARSSDNADAAASAIAFERDASERHFNEGVSSIEKGAEAVIEDVRLHSLKHADHLVPIKNTEIPGRNEPCFCGSGKKYKRCHGQ
ncbi:MAG: SEC-C domain-containing protein [Nitrospirae bacterium]|nr:SEC-C domain-containing protein [Nitrospirota bacterium]